MRRREFIALIGGAAASTRAAYAQQSALPVIGILGAAIPDNVDVARNLAAFRQGLADTGYVEGQNVLIEYRWAGGDYERLPALAADLVARKVNVIVNEGGSPSVLAAKNATSLIPIVFHTGTDPVADGLIKSLASPGGNLTGVAMMLADLSPKLLQFVLEIVPKARVIALLSNPTSQQGEQTLHQLQAVSTRMGLDLHALKAASETEVDAAFASLDREPCDALILANDPFFTTQRDKIIALAARHSIPAIYGQSYFVRAGGLVSYGPSLPAAYRIKGIYAGKILSGSKPTELPVQQPTTIELVINLKTAKSLGLDVPLILQQSADEVIE